jgi:hypothetical protein
LPGCSLWHSIFSNTPCVPPRRCATFGVTAAIGPTFAGRFGKTLGVQTIDAASHFRHAGLFWIGVLIAALVVGSMLRETGQVHPNLAAWSSTCSSSGHEEAAKMLLDNKSRSTLKSPMISRAASPMIKMQVLNAFINDMTLAFSQKVALVRS